jgi:hypothetical protein
MNLGMQGIGLMIGWTIWLVIYLSLVETFERRNSKTIADLTLNDINMSKNVKIVAIFIADLYNKLFFQDQELGHSDRAQKNEVIENARVQVLKF